MSTEPFVSPKAAASGADQEPTTLPADAFRRLWASFPVGVVAVTAADGRGEPRGLTCTATCPVTVEPPILLVVVNEHSNTLSAVLDSRAFVVNFLKPSGIGVAERLASKSPDKFDGLKWEPSTVAAGAPILVEHAAAYAECHVEAAQSVGTHRVVIGRVVASGQRNEEDPVLMYFRRTYYRSDSTKFVTVEDFAKPNLTEESIPSRNSSRRATGSR